MDSKTKIISPEKANLLEIIAAEIMYGLKITKSIIYLQSAAKNAREKQEQVAHGNLEILFPKAKYFKY